MKAFTASLAVLALACTTSVARAQQAVSMEEGHMPKKDKPLESRGMEGGVFMKDGKMMTMRDGTMTPMTAAMTMNNGTKVMPDGSVTMADGKTMMLHNGQFMHLDGRVIDRANMKGKGKLQSSL